VLKQGLHVENVRIKKLIYINIRKVNEIVKLKTAKKKSIFKFSNFTQKISNSKAFKK
jgi:hypothetical protein